jgi:hypothetical protein
LTFLPICSWILLQMRNVSYKSCTENQNTHFIFSNFFSLENRAVYEIIWKNMVEPRKPQTVWSMRVVCWISKATDAQAHARSHAPPLTSIHTHTCMHSHTRAHAHTDIIILIAFPQQQSYLQRAWMLLYTYIACLV